MADLLFKTESSHSDNVQQALPQMKNGSCCSSCCGTPKEDTRNPIPEPELHRALEAGAPASCAIVALIAWVCSYLQVPVVWVQSFYALAIAAGGWPLLSGAVQAVWSRSLDMNVLMTVAVLGACWLGDWAEAATLVVLYAISEWIESQSIRRSHQAMTALMNLAPPRALVKRELGHITSKDGSVEAQLQEIDANDVAINDIFVVRAGERIALDGVVALGNSQVNQAPVTGESLPVEKSVGDEVFAGTLNGPSVLEVRATRLARDGTIAHIARLVHEAEAVKSPRQRTVESFARIYTPLIFVVALIVAVLPPLMLKASWDTSIYRALALLVAACPCGLVLSGPVASICALSAAARRGILIRGGAALETLADVRAIAFDKTGTLTLGTPQVTDFITLNGVQKEPLIAIAGALEQQSRHPLAKAIVDFSHPQNGQQEAMEDVREVEGQGISGVLRGTRYSIGRVGSFTQEVPLSDKATQAIRELQQQGRSVAVLESNNESLAVIGFADTVRASAWGVLSRLQEQGVVARVILSGDNKAAVRNVHEQVGADSYQAELLPGDKLRIVRELSQRHGTIAMVGDGINDAPALAQADIGIAMGAAGSDAALEVSDVALMSDDLDKLPEAIDLARQARSVIIQNICLALAMKLVFVAGLFLGLWGAYALAGGIVADMGATLLVTANGLRLLRARPS